LFAFAADSFKNIAFFNDDAMSLVPAGSRPSVQSLEAEFATALINQNLIVPVEETPLDAKVILASKLYISVFLAESVLSTAPNGFAALLPRELRLLSVAKLVAVPNANFRVAIYFLLRLLRIADKNQRVTPTLKNMITDTTRTGNKDTRAGEDRL
jgi:pilus assembly protein TadC